MPCAICLESKRWYQETRTLKCGHKFHMLCIHKWSSKNQNCPLCRTQILLQKPIDSLDIYRQYKRYSDKSIKQILLEAGIEEEV
jgi:hypothetical protein